MTIHREEQTARLHAASSAQLAPPGAAEASRPDWTREYGGPHPGFATGNWTWPEPGQGPEPGLLAAVARAHQVIGALAKVAQAALDRED